MDILLRVEESGGIDDNPITKLYQFIESGIVAIWRIANPPEIDWQVRFE